MACPRESRKRLRPWLERMINLGECPGLVWENKEERTFRIPWRHFNNRDWVERDSKIFMEWAKYTGKYQEDKIEYPVWKTRLRCALKKIPEIKELPGQHQLDDADPYRVYQFVDAPVMKKGDTDSEGGYSPPSVSSSYCNSPYTRRDCSPSPSPPPNFLYGNGRSNSSANVPTVVFDDDSSYVTLAGFNKVTPNSVFLQNSDEQRSQAASEDYKMPEHIQLQAPQDFNILPGQDFLTETPSPAQNFPAFNLHTASGHTNYSDLTNMVPTLAVSSSQNMAHPNFPASDSQAVPPEPTSMERNSYSNQESMKTSLPSDLRSVDSMDLCIPCDGANIPLQNSMTSFEAPGANSFGYQTNNERPPETQENHQQSIARGPPEAEPSMKLFVSYGSPQHVVMQEMVKSRGCRVFFGPPQLANTMNEEEFFGPRTVEQLEMPDIAKCPDIIDEQKRLIGNLLDGMERGVVLTFKDGDIYAQRLCRTRVFVSDGMSESKGLDRKIKDPIKVYDFKAFKAECEKYRRGTTQVRPKAEFVLTFGQQLKNSLQSPMSKVLFHITIHHTQAQELLSQIPDYSTCSLSSDNLFSACDTYDKILENFKNVNISNHQS